MSIKEFFKKRRERLNRECYKWWKEQNAEVLDNLNTSKNVNK